MQECINRANNAHRAFRVRFNFRGNSWSSFDRDALGAEGLAGDRSGVVYRLWFEDWNSYVSVARYRCPAPLVIAAVEKAATRHILECLPAATREEQLEVIRDDFAEVRNQPRSGGIR